MGIYLNPGNSGFQEVVRSEYVDKTGLIDLVNQTIGTKSKLTCISRPRRFGKTFAAHMLCAYYDCSCDSHELFNDKQIAKTDGYRRHLNQYHVINLDITGFISEAQVVGKLLRDVPLMISDKLLADMRKIFPEIAGESNLTESLVRCVEKTGKKFVFVIDEWDALIREAKNDREIQTTYLNLLREWFKNSNFTPRVVAAAYMTGILPIKKDGSQSAISDFREYTILAPGRFVEYTGFTEKEVYSLCAKHGMSFEDAKKWYDGYDYQKGGAIYNPYSVMQAIQMGAFDSYWKKWIRKVSFITCYSEYFY